MKQNIERLYKIRGKLGRSNPSIFMKILDFNLSDQEKQEFHEVFSNFSDEISIQQPHNWDGHHEQDFTL